MEEADDKIIVYDSYDTVVVANLAKTKLDAYGVPCFLSDENFVGLYPIRNEVFPGVRLHIFEKDREQVQEILKEEVVGEDTNHGDTNQEQTTENETLQCPSCHSQKVVHEKSTLGVFGQILSMAFVSPFMEPKKTYRCQDCNRTFDSV